MLLKKKIIVLTDNYHQASPLEKPLTLAGYDVDCHLVIEGINLCQFVTNVLQYSDLLIADVSPDKHEQLEGLQQLAFIDRLLLVKESFGCAEMYCVSRSISYLCHPFALLAAVKQVFDASCPAEKKCLCNNNYCGFEDVHQIEPKDQTGVYQHP